MKTLDQESMQNFYDKKAHEYLQAGNLSQAFGYAKAAGWPDPLSIYLKEGG